MQFTYHTYTICIRRSEAVIRRSNCIDDTIHVPYANIVMLDVICAQSMQLTLSPYLAVKVTDGKFGICMDASYAVQVNRTLVDVVKILSFFW